MKDEEFYHIIEKYLNGEINSEEQSRLEAWLAHSTENEEYLEQMKSYWELSGNMKPSIRIDTSLAFDTLQSRIHGNASNGANWASFMKVAAAIVLVFTVGYIIYSISQRTKFTEFSTADSTAEVVLPDGSNVFLNANSLIRYADKFEGDSRKIVLKGEGFFEVERDESKPFIINAGSTHIKVLGTSFNVQAYESSSYIEVNVKSGEVGFYKQGEENKMLTLQAGDFATFNKQRNIISLEEQKNLNYLYWKDQKLVFTDTPLEEIFQILGKHFDTQFSIQNPEINNCTFTSSFNDATLDEILEVIHVSLNLEFTSNKNVYDVTGDGCSS